MDNDIEYIPADHIGYKELSAREVKIIKNAFDSTEEKIVSILLTIAVWIGYMILFPAKSVFSRVLNAWILVLLLIYLLLKIHGRLRRHINYTCAADGYVVDREVQFQKINPKDTARLKPYDRNSDTNDSEFTKKRAFFYLTVKLENEAYVRYVNCTEKDYYCLDKGDKVLIIYYGREIIQGYKV